MSLLENGTFKSNPNQSAERFVALIQREPFDDTNWRQDLAAGLSLKEISEKAMALRNKSTEQGA
ncbi:MAG: hypothetical protein BWK72_20850 [Rhodoferax ferrireducens]|uniref:Uncharacterized protein n=1 Tax=Rhodoferax ferrireducens TaxID=192843 RepID=A0A1W9KNJ6_9BURK|nr:MAG: hypothetical protein BWK72_20850 [Rhodoferax ferrireducens]